MALWVPLIYDAALIETDSLTWGFRTDLWYVQESGRAADQSSTREVQLGNRLKTTFIQSSGTICDPLAAFEEVFEERVVFHSLLPADQPRPEAVFVESGVTHLELLVRR